MLGTMPDPGQGRERGNNMNQVPVVKHLIAKKNQKFQINSTHRQPSHQLFQPMDSAAGSIGEGQQRLAQNAAISG